METKVKSGNSIASFVLGIVSIVLSPIGFIIGVIGLINGIISRAKKQGKKGLGVAGIILNAIGIVLGIIADIIIVAIIVLITIFGIGTVASIISLVSIMNESGMTDMLNEVDWSQIDPNDMEGSMETIMADYMGDYIINGALEGIQSDEGLTITFGGSEYNFKGNSFDDMIVTNEETGESFDVKEYIEENPEKRQEIKESLSTELGLSEDEVDSLLDSVSGGDMDVELLMKIYSNQGN